MGPCASGLRIRLRQCWPLYGIGGLRTVRLCKAARSCFNAQLRMSMELCCESFGQSRHYRQLCVECQAVASRQLCCQRSLSASQLMQVSAQGCVAAVTLSSRLAAVYVSSHSAEPPSYRRAGSESDILTTHSHAQPRTLLALLTYCHCPYSSHS